MTATKPRVCGPVRVINGRVQTPPTKRGGAIEIGRAYVRPPARVEGHALHVQAALLEPRTAQRPTLLQRLAGAIWRFA